MLLKNLSGGSNGAYLCTLRSSGMPKKRRAPALSEGLLQEADKRKLNTLSGDQPAWGWAVLHPSFFMKLFVICG
jgi:hypothetical protein